jgi:hypothetical protein
LFNPWIVRDTCEERLALDRFTGVTDGR